MRQIVTWMLGVVLTAATVCAPGHAGQAKVDREDAGPAGTDRVDAVAVERTIHAAVAFLRAQQRSEDGSFSETSGPGITALVATALLRNGLDPADPLLARSLHYLEGFVRPDGGVYREGSLYRNYETSLAIVCFSLANRDGRYKRLLEKADRFVRGLQWSEEGGHEPSSPTYGGAGYGKHKRPDLSNTSFLIEALRADGAGPNDPAIRKALVFVSRCQNLESPYNTTPFSTRNPDGGFYYTPADGGASEAGKTPGGGLRSYGSMTYAGLKSMIYAGVGPDDPRVKAAVKWIRSHYAVRENPGMGNAGLYYYYHTFAKALSAMEQTMVVDQQGHAHNWREELVTELVRRQRPNGSWANTNGRWLESDPNLVTAYALLALSYCH